MFYLWFLPYFISYIWILTIVLILVANWLITQLFTEYLHVLRDDLVYEDEL